VPTVIPGEGNDAVSDLKSAINSDRNLYRNTYHLLDAVVGAGNDCTSADAIMLMT